MFTVESSIFIERPLHKVFDFVSDPAKAPLWQASTVSAEYTSEGPVREGSTHRSVVRFLGREIESTVEYTAWDPPNGYAMEVVSGPLPFKGTARFEAKDGGTLYTISATTDVGGFFSLAEGLVKKRLDKQHEANLGKLKQLLEEG